MLFQSNIQEIMVDVENFHLTDPQFENTKLKEIGLFMISVMQSIKNNDNAKISNISNFLNLKNLKFNDIEMIFVMI